MQRFDHRMAAYRERQRKQLRAIARRYAWDDRERRERGRYPLIIVFRLRDLETLFAHRYGPTLPDDDSGAKWLNIYSPAIFCEPLTSVSDP
jgi:hypothetical protein